MAVSGLIKTLFVAIANAVTYELLVNVPITFIIVNAIGPRTTVSALEVGLVLLTILCVTYIVRYLLGNITWDELLAVFVTLLSYLLPWLALRLMWKPGHFLLYCAARNLPCRPCRVVVCLKIARLVICGVCLYTTFRRIGLGKYWQQMPPGGNGSNANPGIIPNAGNKILKQPSQAQSQPKSKAQSKSKAKPKAKSQAKTQQKPQPPPASRKSPRTPKPTHCFHCG